MKRNDVINAQEKNKILKEMQKSLLVINDFSGLTQNYIVNIPTSLTLPYKDWIIKYSDIKSVKYTISFVFWCYKSIRLVKTMTIIDKNNKKYKLFLANTSLPFFYYHDIELIKKINKILKSKNPNIEIDDKKLKKLEDNINNKMFENLTWDNNIEDIKKYIEKHLKHVDIKLFLQPTTEKYSKNVWEGCALVIDNQSDETIEPYIKELLSWLQDANWPGFNIILNRLKRMNIDKLLNPLEETIKTALKENDEMWLYWLNLLLENEEIKNKIDSKILKDLMKYCDDGENKNET